MSHVAFFFDSLPACELSRQRDSFDLRDVFAEDCALSETHLEAVVVGRIVTAGYHHTAIYRLCKKCEVKRGSRNHSNVQHVAACFSQASYHQVAKDRRAFARIAPEARVICAVRSEEGTHRAG